MQTFRPAVFGILAAVLLSPALVRAEAPDPQPVIDKTLKSIVLVEYTFRNENVSREENGQGIVVSKDGVVLISGTLIPEVLPKEWIRDLKIRLPGKRYTTVPATFLGRTTNRMFAYVKAGEPIDASPLDISATGGVKIGQDIFSTAIAGKSSGYQKYAGFAKVRAVLRLSHTLAVTQTFGLTRANSPVFDQQTGALVGITFPAIGETVVITEPGMGGSRVAQIKDEDQSSVLLPFEEIKDVLTNVPDAPFDNRRPWLGVDGLTGVEEEVRTKYGIADKAAVAIGAVIPDMPADKAGLQGRDIILTIDGKPFSQAVVPDLVVAHFQGVLEKTKIGQELKLGILRDEKPMEVTVKIAAQPKIGAEMAHVFSEKIGITTRDLVFGDTYSRKLGADQKGVYVAMVKQGAAASLGTTPLRAGYLITKVNEQAVDDQKQFAAALKAATEGEDAEKKEIVFLVIQGDGKTQVCRVDLSK